MSRHVVLLGDSILDNASYVSNGGAVIDHLKQVLPRGDKATLLASDGAPASSVFRQVERIPGDVTHLVLSAGGNDARWTASNIFTASVDDVQSALQLLAEGMLEFRHQYRNLVSELRSLGHHLTVCTVYDAIPLLDAAKRAGLCVFNDTITRTAFENDATLIDLRLVCNEVTDYSNISPIEPSVAGGRKIAQAILAAISGNHRVIP